VADLPLNGVAAASQQRAPVAAAYQDHVLDKHIAALRRSEGHRSPAIPGSEEALIETLAGVAPADEDDEDPNNPPQRNSTDDKPMKLQDLLAVARIKASKVKQAQQRLTAAEVRASDAYDQWDKVKAEIAKTSTQVSAAPIIATRFPKDLDQAGNSSMSENELDAEVAAIEHANPEY